MRERSPDRGGGRRLRRSGDQFPETGQERAKSTAAMTDGVLLLERNFRHGESELRKEEEGIVSEAAGSAREVRISPSTKLRRSAAPRGLWRGPGRSGNGRCGGRCRAGGTEGRGYCGRRWRSRRCHGDIARILGKARGAYAGFASQGVDFEAGIVGEDESRGEAAVVLRLETSVAGEGRFILGRRGDFVEIRQRRDGEPAFGSGDREVAELAGLVVAA